MIHKVKKRFRELSINHSFARKLYSFLHQKRNKLTANMSDQQFAVMKYKEATGRKLNLDNPVTYDDKVWWLKLNNRDPLMTLCSDKYRVREYVKDCGLEHILNDLYGVYKDANDIDLDMLPDRFILKCNHGCGGSRICKDKATFPIDDVRRSLNKCLRSNYFVQSREWNYKNIEPLIVCERLFDDKDNGPVGLVDYKFMCFDGVVKLVLVQIDACAADGSHRYDSRRNTYDENFNLLDVHFTSRKSFDSSLVMKPSNFDVMRQYAEVLSKPFVHCRVDLYNIQGKIYFGEITFYPAGGTNPIEPAEWTYKLGDLIDLSSEKIVRDSANGA